MDKSIADRIEQHLRSPLTDYEIVLAVNFEIHKWLREQEGEVVKDLTAQQFLTQCDRDNNMIEDDIETTEDLIKWFHSHHREGGIER